MNSNVVMNDTIRELLSRRGPQYDMTTICENCNLALGEHKGFHCVKGPKHFRTIAATDYKGQLIVVAQ